MPPISRSNVWSHFIKVDKTSATCRYCRITFKPSGNKTNLWAHLKRKHSEKVDTSGGERNTIVDVDVDEQDKAENSKKDKTRENNNDENPLEEDIQPTITQTFLKIGSYKSGGELNDKITEKIINMIIKDGQPFTLVEDEGFNELLQLIAPLYKIPSRRTIINSMEKKYEIIRTNMKKKLSNRTVCLTSDIWTEKYNFRSFIGVTCHFIENNIKLESIILGVYPLKEAHTAQHISHILKQICSAWDITKDNISAVVTDNGSNI